MRKKTNSGFKKVLMIYGGVLLVLIATCVIVYIVYNNKIKESAKQSLLAAEKLTELVPNTGALEEASTEISKTINEVLEETASEINQNDEDENTQENNQTENVEVQEPVVEPEPVKELEFAYPVNGEISKPFSIDNLIFSETLQEWVVHKGIDIKAPRTTVVKSAEEGTVKAIKNDPRYGLTVVISHDEGYETIYSNLLTAEFVVEGEEVKQGQTIGTAGNTASFESGMESHLHFEIMQDGKYLNPSIYLK